MTVNELHEALTAAKDSGKGEQNIRFTSDRIDCPIDGAFESSTNTFVVYNSNQLQEIITKNN